MNHLVRFFSLIACLAFATGCSQARASRVQVIDYGVYRVTNEKSVASSNSPTGIVRTGGTFELSKQTETIPTKIGTAFGVRFSLPRELEKTQLKYVYLFPEMKNPANGKAFSSFESLGQEGGHGPSTGMFYNFTDPWELVAGEWTFQAFANDQLLLEKKFSVVKAD